MNKKIMTSLQLACCNKISLFVREKTKCCVHFLWSVYNNLFALLVDNWNSKYLKKDEVSPGVEAGAYEGEVRSDVTTSFFILLAIFFPSVTGR